MANNNTGVWAALNNLFGALGKGVTAAATTAKNTGSYQKSKDDFGKAVRSYVSNISNPAPVASKAPLSASPYTLEEVTERYRDQSRPASTGYIGQPTELKSTTAQSEESNDEDKGIDGALDVVQTALKGLNTPANKDENKDDSNNDNGFWTSMFDEFNSNVQDFRDARQQNVDAYRTLFPQAALFADTITKQMNPGVLGNIRKQAGDINAVRQGNIDHQNAIDAINSQLTELDVPGMYSIGDDGNLYIDNGDGDKVRSLYNWGGNGVNWTLSGQSIDPSDEASIRAAMYLDRNRNDAYGDNWGMYQTSGDKEWWRNAMRSNMLNPYYSYLSEDAYGGFNIMDDADFDRYWDYMNNITVDPASMSDMDLMLVYGDAAGAMNSTNSYLASNPNFMYGLYGEEIGDLSDEQLKDMQEKYGIGIMDDNRLYLQGSSDADRAALLQGFLNRATIEDAMLRGLGGAYTPGELDFISRVNDDQYGYGINRAENQLMYDYGDISDLEGRYQTGEYNPYALDISNIAGVYTGNGSLNPEYNDVIGNKSEVPNTKLGYYSRR